MDVSLDYINQVIARNNASNQAGAKKAPAFFGNTGKTEIKTTVGTAPMTDTAYRQQGQAVMQRQAAYQQELTNTAKRAAAQKALQEQQAEQAERNQKIKELSTGSRAERYNAVQAYLAGDVKAKALWDAENGASGNLDEIQQLRSAMSDPELQVYEAAKQARQEYGGKLYELGQDIGYLAKSAGTGLVSGVANIYNNLIDTDQAARELMARYTLSAAGGEEEAREQNRAWYDEQTKVLRPASQGALPAFDELSPEEQEIILQTGPYATVSMKRANAYRQQITGAEAVRRQDMLGENSLEDLGKLAGTYQQESGKNGAVQMAGNVASAIGGMAPNIAANMAGMPGLGWYSLYAGSAGGAAQQARDAGADTLTAATAGALSGAVEMATEKMFDGIPGMSQGNRFAVSDAVEKGIQKYIKSATGQKVVGKLADVLGEGAEEYVSELAGSYIAQLYQEDNRTFLERASDPDTWYAFAVGSLTSGVMNAGAGAISAAERKVSGTQVQNQQKQENLEMPGQDERQDAQANV